MNIGLIIVIIFEVVFIFNVVCIVICGLLDCICCIIIWFVLLCCLVIKWLLLLFMLFNDCFRRDMWFMFDILLVVVVVGVGVWFLDNLMVSCCVLNKLFD